MLYAAYRTYNSTDTNWLNKAAFVPPLRNRQGLQDNYIWYNACYTAFLTLDCLWKFVLDYNINLEGCMILKVIQVVDDHEYHTKGHIPDFTTCFEYDWTMVEDYMRRPPDPRC